MKRTDMARRHDAAVLIVLFLALGNIVMSVDQASATTTAKARLARARFALVARPSADDQAFAVRRGTEALDLVRGSWRKALLGWEITFAPARSGQLGLTYPLQRRIEIFVRANRSRVDLAHDIAHEIGHAIDVLYNTSDDRGRFLELRGVTGNPSWFTCSACGDLGVPAGDFAETYARWAVPGGPFLSRLARPPSAEALERIATELYPLHHLLDEAPANI